MTKQEIYAQIETLIEERLREKIEITPDFRIREDLNVDSVDLMEFIIALEDTFDIEISDPEADTIFTLQDVVDFVSEKIAK